MKEIREFYWFWPFQKFGRFQEKSRFRPPQAKVGARASPTPILCSRECHEGAKYEKYGALCRARQIGKNAWGFGSFGALPMVVLP
jgi:hypothetical protein